jgi:MFS family permease
VAFAIHEGVVAREPLMPLSVFRMRTLRAANTVIFLLYAAIFAFWFVQSLYMQGTLGYSALETGLAFVPMTAAVGTGATLAPRLARRFSPRAVLVAGMLFATAGEALLTGVHPGGTYVAQVLPGGVLGALGLGLALVPATIVAVQGVPAAASGLASGVLNTSRFVGAALGLAVLSTIAASHTSGEVASGTGSATALTDGFALQFKVGALFCLAGAVAAVIMLRPKRPERAAEQVAEPGRA